MGIRKTHTIDDRGPYLQVGPHGRVFYLLDPTPEEVFIEDIAWSLGKLCRFNGHCTRPYSVAEHSVLVSEVVNHKLALWGLMHDAEEAYTGDLTRSMKTALEIIAPGAFKKIAKPIQRVIMERFGLDWPEPTEVKEADGEMLTVEYQQNMPQGACMWYDLAKPPQGVKVRCLDHMSATTLFTARAKELGLNYAF